MTVTQDALARGLRTDALSPYLRVNPPLPPEYAIKRGAEVYARVPRIEAMHAPDQNHLLGGLPADDMERLRPHLQPVDMKLGDSLYEPGTVLEYAYFPTTAIVSIQYVMLDGRTAESASVANEGMVGIAQFMGGITTTDSAMVQAAGHAYRLPARMLAEEFRHNGAVRHLLMRYTRSLMAQMMQQVGCSRHHRVEQQLSRWLLTMQDRTLGNAVMATQELIASVLGVRREAITEITGKLRRVGCITCSRGIITVVDRPALMKWSCECYGVVRNELRSLLADVQQWKNVAISAERPAWREQPG